MRENLSGSFYPTTTITNQYGEQEEVYTEGPRAGYNPQTGALVIQESVDDGLGGGDGKFMGEFGDGNGQGGEDTPAKTITDTKPNGDGTYTVIYSDGTSEVKGSKINQGNVTLPDTASMLDAANKKAERQSAYDLLYSQFKTYGLESLVEPLKGLITSGASPAEFTIKLRESDAYKQRFAANAARVQKGLKALDEAAYIGLEDQYQNIMRNYGLPASYWEKDALGTQKGFTDLIANDVAATELENRVQKATDFIDKGPKAYADALKQFYPEVERGDLLAYVLDPKNALTKIQTKIGAAKIGGEYLNAGLTADQARAEELNRLGITSEQARSGAQAVKENAQLGSQYAQMYGLEPYGQLDVEEEAYGLGKAAEAKKKREKIVGAVTADFSGRSGLGALNANRAGLY